ncbi:hypothetical protein ACIBO9_43295 [Streptomyces prunicolor]|uniref:hypothetical protein n=1 Tax=Streptomyces prunicolor TaxID=67348 RepID=UPI0037CF0AD4
MPDSLSMIGRPSYGFTTLPPDAVRDDTRLGLTVAASLLLPELRAFFGEPFLRIMHHMIKAYREAPSDVNAVKQVWLTSSDLQAAVPISQETFWIGLPEMLGAEVATRRGSHHTAPDGSWRREVTREVLQFRGCRTIDQYVAKVSEMVTGWAHEQDQQLGRVIPVSGQRFSRPSAIAMPEGAKPEKRAEYALQDLHINTGDNSPVTVNAPISYAEKDGTASSTFSQKSVLRSESTREEGKERPRSERQRKKFVRVGVAAITVSTAIVIAALIPGAGFHSTAGSPSSLNSSNGLSSNGDSARRAEPETPPDGTCVNTCRTMRVGGSRTFDIDSWGVKEAISLGDLTSSGLTVKASHGTKIRAVSNSGRLDSADCPTGGKRDGSIQLSDGQRACLVTERGNTVMIQRHFNKSVPYDLFYVDLGFIPHA